MDANGGVKRRLPSWMLGGQVDASNVEDEEKVGKGSRKAKPKVQKEGKENSKASSKKPLTVLERRPERKRAKREGTPDDDEISLDDEDPREKRKSRRKGKACLEIETDKDDEISLDDEFYDEAPREKRKLRRKGKACLEIETDKDDEISLDDEFYDEPPREKRKSRRKGKACLEIETDKDDEISLDDEFYDEPPREKRKSRRKGKACLEIETDKDDEINLDDNELYEEAPKKKRKLKKKDKTTDKDDEISLDDELYEKAPRKKRTLKKKDSTCLEIRTDKDVDESEEDLTVEDLLSIAKEYVEEDNKVAGINSRDANLGSFENRASISSTMAENSTSDAGLQQPAVSGKMSMLDLMLGPLYQNTGEQEKEKKLDLESTSFKHEEMKQPRSVVEEPVVVPKKKKSSFKDMVAMYLD